MEKISCFVIPREIGEAYRIAVIPDFHSLYRHRNPGEGTWTYEYKSKNLHILAKIDGNEIDKYKFSKKELSLADCRYEHSIANYLISQRACTGDIEIKGNIKELTKEIYGHHQPKRADYSKVLINFIFLANSVYCAVDKTNHKKDRHFKLIKKYHVDKDSFDFFCIIDHELVPQVYDGNETLVKKYTRRLIRDLYPRWEKHEYNMRQYLSEKKNLEKAYRTKGEALLEMFGYNINYQYATYSYKKCSYRDKVAYDLVKYYCQLAQKYPVKVTQLDKHSVYKIKQQSFLTEFFSPRKENKLVPREKMKHLVEQVSNLITESKRYFNKSKTEKKAKTHINKHGYNEINEILVIQTKSSCLISVD